MISRECHICVWEHINIHIKHVRIFIGSIDIVTYFPLWKTALFTQVMSKGLRWKEADKCWELCWRDELKSESPLDNDW